MKEEAAGRQLSRTSRGVCPCFLLILLFASLLPPPSVALGANLTEIEITAPTQRAGEVETWTLKFRLPQGGDLSGFSVVSNFPSGFGFQAGRACDVQDASGETISVSGQEVTCTIGSGTFAQGATLTTRITQVKNPGFAQTTSNWAVGFRNNLGVTVGSGNYDNARIYNNLFTSLSASAADNRAGETTDWTLHLTTKNAVGADGDVRLLFPYGFDVQPDAACSIPGLSGLTLSRVSSTEAVCNLNSANLAADSPYDLAVTKVKNPTWSQSPLLRVQSRNAENKLHDELNTTLAVQPHPFASASALPDDPHTGATTTWRFTATLHNPWPANGCFRVTFPAGFTLGASSFTLTQGADGSMGATSVSGNTATACRQGGTPTGPGSAITQALNDVQNPKTDDPVNVLLETVTSLYDGIDQTLDEVPGLLGSCQSDCGPPPPPPGAPSAPRSLTASAQGTQVQLAWQTPADLGEGGVRNYKVYRAAAIGGPYVVAAQLENVTTYSEARPATGSTRYYLVSAVNAVGEGNASNLVSVTGPSPPSVTFPTSRPPGQSGTSSGPPRVDPLDPGSGGGGWDGSPPQVLAKVVQSQAAVWGGLAVLGLGSLGGGGYWWWRRSRVR